MDIIIFYFLIPGTGTAGLGADTGKQLSLIRLSPDLEVENRCGVYFGYEAISGTTLKRVMFNYEDDGNLLFSTVAYSMLVTEIDDSKTEPTVEYTASGDIVVRISDKDYQKEKDCLPPPGKQEPPTP